MTKRETVVTELGECNLDLNRSVGSGSCRCVAAIFTRVISFSFPYEATDLANKVVP